MVWRVRVEAIKAIEKGEFVWRLQEEAWLKFSRFCGGVVDWIVFDGFLPQWQFELGHGTKSSEKN